MSLDPTSTRIPAARVLIVHYAEVALKRGNRPYFERKLAQNLRWALRGLNEGPVERMSGRMVARLAPGVGEADAAERVRHVYGVSNFSIGVRSATDLGSLESAAAEVMKGLEYGTFAIDTRRVDKRYPLSSPQINAVLGRFVLERFGGRVDLEDPQLTVGIELLAGEAFVYANRHPGPGGLPVGSGGRLLALLSAGIDSPIAAHLMLKRGAHVDFVHFHSAPFTDAASQEKAVELASMVCRYQRPSRLYLVPFADAQRAIVAGAPEPFRVLLYRRFMGRIAERLAGRIGAAALVTGDSLGQVASQTLENIVAIEEALAVPVLRPLVGFDKQEIIELARRLGTYNVSIEPHDDCCSFLMPRNPATRARAEELRDAESSLPMDELVRAAAEAAEVRWVGYFPERPEAPAEAPAEGPAEARPEESPAAEASPLGQGA
jgi:thiamine biosynthesis protein ThiI